MKKFKKSSILVLSSIFILATTTQVLADTTKTLHAKWQPIQYEITYDFDGGTVIGNPTTYSAATPTILLRNPVKSGYEFKGWSGTDLVGDKNTKVRITFGSTGNRSYKAHWRGIYTVPHSDDAAVQIENIKNFIDENKNTDQYIGFQCTRTGKLYAKAGIFSSRTNPNIDSDANGGILIYSGNNYCPGQDNRYIQAAHIANIINYIIYQIKGSPYGSESPVFTDTPESGDYITTKSISKGVYHAAGTTANSEWYFRGEAGYFSGRGMFSDNGVEATWY